MSKGLSIRGYAKHRGVTHKAVQKAIEAGRITTEPDGKIDPEKADAEWKERTNPRASKAKGNGAAKPAETAVALASPEPQKESLGGTFVQARTMTEVAKAQRMRLEVQKMQGDLVDRKRAVALIYRLARQERDAWKNWVAREAPRMAADLGADAGAVQTVLETYVRKHLNELSEIKPDFG